MATRIKDGMIPYTGGIGIEITNNHVINVLLRELNNLIHVNENRELYVDLQLDDGIQPDDDFPVGVTTGKILQEDGWQQSGIILNWKTTSGDYVRLIYANDGKLYYDPGTGEWIELATGESIAPILENLNVKMFEIDSISETTVGQEVVDWYLDGNYPIIVYNNQSYIQEATPTQGQIRFYGIHTTQVHGLNTGTSSTYRNELYATYADGEFTGWMEDFVQMTPTVVSAGRGYQTAYIPTEDGDPATKKYVDDGLATKQDKLTPGTRITIDQNNVISADISGVMTYMGNVTDSSQLPTTGQNQGDCWYDETAKTLWAWDGTQWNDVGGTGIDLTNYFNMQTNTSDDITEGTTNLFVTQQEKDTWDGKQDALTAGANITIDANNVISATDTDTTYSAGDGINIDVNNVISNAAKFDPENAGSLGQFLKKTNDGYQWADIPGGGSGTSYTAGDGIDITNNVISATDRFTPTNQGTVGQVLKKSGADTYYWANESGGGGGGGGNFNPTNTGTTGQILTKTGSTYAWMDNQSNVKCFDVNFVNPTQASLKSIADWVDADETNGAIIKTGQQDVFLYSYKETSGNITQYHFFSYRNRTGKTTTVNGDFTSLKQVACTLSYNEIEYSISAVDFNTVTNFLVVESSGYTTPYMPTAGYQPATKAYVDSRNWVGTQAEYNALVNQGQIEQGVIYNIIPS